MPTILVVDDSRLMRDMVVAALRGVPNRTFRRASSGLEAIEAIALERPDLVVLDLNMPDMNGFEVLEFVRGQAHLATLPVLVLTTRTGDQVRDAALDAGASAYMSKPFAPPQLQATVEGLLADA